MKRFYSAHVMTVPKPYGTWLRTCMTLYANLEYNNFLTGYLEVLLYYEHQIYIEAKKTNYIIINIPIFFEEWASPAWDPPCTSGLLLFNRWNTLGWLIYSTNAAFFKSPPQIWMARWAKLPKSFLFVLIRHGAFLGTFRFVGFYKKVLYTTV